MAKDASEAEPNVEKPYPCQLMTLSVIAASLSCWALIILVAEQFT